VLVAVAFGVVAFGALTVGEAVAAPFGVIAFCGFGIHITPNDVAFGVNALT